MKCRGGQTEGTESEAKGTETRIIRKSKHKHEKCCHSHWKDGGITQYKNGGGMETKRRE